MNKKLTFTKEIEAKIQDFLNCKIEGVYFKHKKESWITKISSIFFISFSDFVVDKSFLKNKINAQLLEQMSIQLRLIEKDSFLITLNHNSQNIIDISIEDLNKDIDIAKSHLKKIIICSKNITDVSIADQDIDVYQSEKGLDVDFYQPFIVEEDYSLMKKLRLFIMKELIVDYLKTENNLIVESKDLNYIPKEFLKFYRTLGKDLNSIDFIKNNSLYVPEHLDLFLEAKNKEDIKDIENLIHINITH